jgi:BASS family bile acid:Na+ symporter
VAALARRLTATEWRVRQGRRLDGLAVVMLFGFALAIMDGVGPVLEAEPARVLGLIGLSFLACGGMMAATTLAFWPAGRRAALGLGYLSSSRNMGVLLAGLPAGADPDIALWFALAQFPLYMLPALIRPLVRRVTG